jgi:hypothetical protein
MGRSPFCFRFRRRWTPARAVAIEVSTATGPEGTPVAVSAEVTEANTPETVTYVWEVIKDGGSTPFATGSGADFSFTPVNLRRPGPGQGGGQSEGSLVNDGDVTPRPGQGNGNGHGNKG